MARPKKCQILILKMAVLPAQDPVQTQRFFFGTLIGESKGNVRKRLSVKEYGGGGGMSSLTTIQKTFDVRSSMFDVEKSRARHSD